MLDLIRSGFEKQLPKELVGALLETYSEVKRNYYLGHLRSNEVEGGRFAEAVFRIIEYRVRGRYTPIGTQISMFEQQCTNFAGLPQSAQPESIRLHIPRTIRLVYDIRNKRDAAHLADGIDPNLQDASFVVSCCDWVMAELVRLYHNVSADQAHAIIEELVKRKVPTIEVFGDGFLKTLNPKLKPSERVLVLLYHRGNKGASFSELESWVKPAQRSNLGRTLTTLEHDKDLIVETGDVYIITKRGINEVDRQKLLKLD